EKNTVRAPALTDCAVSCLAGAKITMLLPHMTQAQPWLPLFDHDRSFWTRTIIGNYHLEIAVTLPRQRAQDSIESILAVVGRDNHRDQFSQGRVPSARLSYSDSKCLQRWRLPAESPRGHRENPPSQRRSAETPTARARFRLQS